MDSFPETYNDLISHYYLESLQQAVVGIIPFYYMAMSQKDWKHTYSRI